MIPPPNQLSTPPPSPSPPTLSAPSLKKSHLTFPHDVQRVCLVILNCAFINFCFYSSNSPTTRTLKRAVVPPSIRLFIHHRPASDTALIFPLHAMPCHRNAHNYTTKTPPPSPAHTKKSSFFFQHQRNARNAHKASSAQPSLKYSPPISHSTTDTHALAPSTLTPDISILLPPPALFLLPPLNSLSASISRFWTHARYSLSPLTLSQFSSSVSAVLICWFTSCSFRASES